MELSQVMRTAGSTRRFTADPVPDELVYRVLDDARFAPSGNNRQGWRVIVVRDPGLRVELRDLYRRSWYSYHAPLFTPPGQQPAPDHYADHLDEIPVHLVVLVERAALQTTIEALDSSHHVGGASIYPFVQNLVLGLRAAGLGTTLSTVLVPVEAEVRKLLRIPDGVGIAAHLGVGWPAGPLPTRLTRRPVADFATVDRFDGQAFQPPPH
jgi:nitroreductase